MLYLIISVNFELGFGNNKNDNTINNLIFKTTSIQEEGENEEQYSNNIEANNEISGNSISSIKNILNQIKKNKKLNSKNTINEVNESVLQKIKKIKNIFFEIILFDFILICILILFLFFKYMNHQKDNDINSNIIKNKNNEWSFKCDLNEMDFIFNSLEFISFIKIAIMGNRILEFSNIFKITKYITYSIQFAVIFGPLANVIYY